MVATALSSARLRRVRRPRPRPCKYPARMRAAWCEVIAALFIMSNKPDWGGTIAAVVIAAVVGAGLAQLGTKQAA